MKTNDKSEYDCMFGLVVNPKDGRLYPAYRKDESTVEITNLTGTMLEDENSTLFRGSAGKGYFNQEQKYAEPSEITGLPRVHTPGGVTEKGAGLGTVLYTSLCFAAHLSFRGLIRFDTGDYSGDGVCSSESSRSKSASMWWRAAAAKYGLVSQISNDIVGCVEDKWEDDHSQIAAAYIEEKLSRDIGSRDFEILSFNIDAIVEMNKKSKESADAYMFIEAKKHNLPVAWFYNDRLLNFNMTELSPTEWYEVNVPALVNANMSELNPEREADRMIAFGIMAAAKHHGASAKDVDFMLERFQERIDVDMKPDPRDPQFQESISRYDVLASGRTFLSPKRKVGKGVSRRVAPRRMVWSPVSASGKVTGPQVEKLSRLAEARRKLGWDVFSE